MVSVTSKFLINSNVSENLSLLRDSDGSGKDPASGAPPAASFGLLSAAVVLFPHRR